MQHVIAEEPLGKICVDIYGPLPPSWNGLRYIFVVLDCFSRFVRLYPIKRATAVIVTNRMVDDFMKKYGNPKTVVSDHGVQFKSRVWQSRISELGVQITTTSVYHPQSNPSERVMRELGRLFRTYCFTKHTEWSQYVRYIEWVLNNTIHESTGHTPQELFLGVERYDPLYSLVEAPRDRMEDPNTRYTIAREIQRTKAEQRRIRHDRIGNPINFRVGEQVLIRTHNLSSAIDKQIHKFFLLYEGPYIIHEIKQRNAYVVYDPGKDRIRGTYNVIFLRKYVKAVPCLQVPEPTVFNQPTNDRGVKHPTTQPFPRIT